MSVPVMIGSLGDGVPSIDKDAWVAPGAVVVGAVHIGRFASVWYGSSPATANTPITTIVTVVTVRLPTYGDRWRP